MSKPIMPGFPSPSDPYAAEAARIVDAAPDAIARYNREYRHLFVNRRLARYVGLPAAHVLGRTLSDLGLAPASVPAWQAALRRVFETGEEATVTFALAGVPGPMHFEARLVPEFDAAGRVETVLSFARERSEPPRALALQ